MENKKLEDMTLEELWRLFPVSLVLPRAEWDDWYRDEAKAVLALIPHAAVKRLSHIGSTAVPGIRAKNIVDMLLEMRHERDLRRVKEMLVSGCWVCMKEDAQRVSLNKGYTETGFAERVFHLHVRLAGDNTELYFRDYLREHPDAAAAYERLKLTLWKRYEHDRDGYTEAKGEFVRQCTAIARELYRGRYD
jgi:GrpB-like predicted nucleotidyltransferase (UPF0157 family)